MNRVLLVEDDPTFSKIVDSFLTKKGFLVTPVFTLKSGKELLRAQTFDLLLLDYRMPDGIGLDLISEMGVEFPILPVIVITGFNDVRTAVKSMQSGAFEYIIKPVNPEELLMVIHTALGEKPVIKTEKTPFIRGESEVAKKLYEYVNIVAPTEMSVMLIGESGTGKEHIARTIHDQSKRAGQPFVAVDCGVLSKELAGSELFGHVKGAFTGALLDKKGMLERADGGTLFLDEIGNLGYDVQVQLLRTLQERTIQPIGSGKTIPVNIRLITATNENLPKEIEAGNFREDIYHRINEFKIQLPPLRKRGEDLTIFIDYFVEVANKELGRSVKKIAPEVLDIFHAYDWPGNLRELKNVIKRMVLLCQGTVAGVELLPEEMTDQTERTVSPHDLKALQENNERDMIMNALVQTKYNKTKAAQLLNIDRKTLYNKIEKYNLE